MEPEEFEYLVPVSVGKEVTKQGRKYVMLRFTNEVAKEFITAQTIRIATKREEFNPDDATDRKEMAISEQIKTELLEVYKMMNPS